MFPAGKIANVIEEMKRLQIDILGCSEVKWSNPIQYRVDEYHIFYLEDTGTIVTFITEDSKTVTTYSYYHGEDWT